MKRQLFSLLLSSAVSACGITADDTMPLADTQQEIINGTIEASNIAGVVQINSSAGLCSGTLLNKEWILTAKHCFVDADLANPSGVSVSLNSVLLASPENRTGSRILQHPTLDISLVKVNSAFGVPSTYYRPIYDGSTDSLVNTTLTCYGYGRNTFTSGSGSLRKAELKVDSKTETEYKILKNASGQILWRGDSGGPCMQFFGPTGTDPYVTGVSSWCSYSESESDVKDCHQVSAAALRDWVYGYVPPQIAIIHGDSRTIDNLRVWSEFKIDGASHVDYEDQGLFNHTTINGLNGNGGTWVSSQWEGDFLSLKNHRYINDFASAAAKQVVIRKEDERPIRNLRIHVQFSVAGAQHYDYEDVGDFTQTKNLVLNGRDGTWSGTQWVGNFLRACQSPTCL